MIGRQPRFRSSRAAVLVLLAAGLPLLFACSPEHEIVMECADAGGIEALCGFRNPEDLALLPDGHTLVVSQFGLMDGSQGGSLALFDSASDASHVAWRGGPAHVSAAPGATPAARWGDPACPGPPDAAFSPHGIDLARQADGRLRLLVVNHGGRESIEFYEVEGGADGYRLAWRGCAIPPAGTYMNDVVNLPQGGFLVTHMMPKESETLGMIRGSLGLDTGLVYEWRPGDARWQPVPGTDAPFPNGIELSEDGRFIYLNAYLASEVRRIDRTTGEIVARAAVSNPDNSAWAPDGRLLVASHTGGFADQTACYGLTEGACPMAFEIVALDPETLAAETLVAQAGPPMGAGTVAVDLGDAWLVGSFASDRMIRIAKR